MSGEHMESRGAVTVSSTKPSSGIVDSGLGKHSKSGRICHTGHARVGQREVCHICWSACHMCDMQVIGRLSS